jgi:Na+-translocating ferredoxin:NAD+ oxidoreductase RNF subunit RnfB
MVPDELKSEPRSKGIVTPRKKKPKELAVITECCIGCKKCTSKGPDGAFLDGCPWDAIVMVDTTEVEKEVGVMTY